MMDPRLAKIVAAVQEHPAPNPDGEEISVDASQLLQLELLRSGIADEFDEDQIYDALDAIGLPKEAQVAWLEDFASYI
jgi:hypothetical protein